MKAVLRGTRRLALALGLLLAIVAGGLWLGRDALLRRAVDEFLPADGSVSIGQIRWTGWLEVEAGELRARGDGWEAQVRQAQVRAGWDSASGFRIEEAALLDVRVDGGSDGAEAPAPEAQAEAGSLPGDLPNLRIEGLDVEWRLRDGRSISLRRARAALAGLDLGVEADEAAFRGPDFELASPLTARLRGTAPGAKRVELAAWTWDPRVAVRHGLLDWSGRRLLAELDADACSGNVRVAAELDADRGDARLELRGMDAREAAAWAGLPACSGRIDAQGEVSFAWRSPEAARVAAQVSLAGGSVSGVELDLRGSVLCAGGRLAVRDMLVLNGANAAWISIAELPLSAATTCGWSASGTLDARASLHDLPLAPAGARAATTTRIELRAKLLDGIARLDGTSLETEDGGASADELALPLLPVVEAADEHSALAALGRDERTRLRARLAFHDIGDTLRFLGLAPPGSDEEFLGRAEAACVWQGGPRGGKLDVDAHVVGARVLDVRVDELRLRGALEDGEARRARLEVVAGTSLGAVEGGGSWDIDERRIDVQARLSLLDLSRLPFPLEVSGDARAALRLQGPLDDLDGEIDLQAERLAIEGLELSGLRLQAERLADHWSVRKAEARWNDVAVELAGDGRRQADGSVRATLEQATVARGDRRWRLERAAELLLGADGVLACEAGWTGDEGALRARTELDLDALRGTLIVDAQLHDLQRVAELGLPAGTSTAEWDGRLQLELDGGPRSAAAEGAVRLALPGQAGPLAARGSVRWTPERIVADVESFALDEGASAGAEKRLLHGSLHASLPLDGSALARSGDVLLAADLHADEIARLLPPPSAGRLSGKLDIRARFSGTVPALAGEAQLGLTEWRFCSEDGGSEIGPFHAQLDARLGRDGIALAASQASLQGVTRTTIDAALDIVPDLGAMLANPDMLLDAPVRLSVGGELGDLSPLAGQLEAVRRLQGRITGRLVLAGTLRGPHLGGEARLEDGELRLAADVPALSALQATVRFDDRRADLFDAHGELGGAPFQLRGGARWDSGAPELDLALEGKELLLVRSRHLAVRADAQLRLAGPVSSPLLSGRATLSDGRWTKPLDPLALALRPRTYRGDDKDGLFRIDDPRASRLRFDVQIDARAPFRVENELLRLHMSPALRLGGTGALPTLAGEVRLEPSRAFLPASIVEIDGGALRFRPSRPDTVELELAGRTTVMGYEVALQIAGTSDDPLVQLSSSPPASREDLALLVLTGRPPGGSVFGSGERAARGVALYVARDLLSSGPVEAGSMMERIEIVSGARTSRRGVDTIELRLRVGGEGRWESLYLAADRDVHEDWNYGLRFVWRPR